MTRIVPDRFDADSVFVYASSIVHDRDHNQWEITIDPDNSLVGAVGPSIQALQDERPAVTTAGRRRIYDGRILLSAGVVFMIGDRHLLLRRGENAPTDPEKWTSPAGRCEHDPATTALTEFHEELVITAQDRPVFVTDPDRSQIHADTYAETLDRVGIDVPREEWQTVEAGVPDEFVTQLSTITTEYGNQQFTDEMLAYYDGDANTLELRFVLRIDPPEPLAEALRFSDGEFNRAVGLFDRAELCELPPSELVPTDAYLAAEIIPELDG